MKYIRRPKTEQSKRRKKESKTHRNGENLGTSRNISGIFLFAALWAIKINLKNNIKNRPNEKRREWENFCRRINGRKDHE